MVAQLKGEVDSSSETIMVKLRAYVAKWKHEVMKATMVDSRLAHYLTLFKKHSC